MTTRPAVKLAPSMMCASFLELNKDLEALKSGGIELLHMDIMDGAYVPNFSLGADYCKAVHSECPIVQDIHLMIENVDKHLPLFCGIHLGVRVTIHPETSRHPVASLQKIRELGASPGIAIDPAQPVSLHQHLFGFVDHVCVMTVNPGYAGQKLVPGTIGKLTEAREFLDMAGKTSADVTVDGNVSWENIPSMLKAGANALVCGTSSIFQKSQSLPENIAKLRMLVSNI